MDIIALMFITVLYLYLILLKNGYKERPSDRGRLDIMLTQVYVSDLLMVDFNPIIFFYTVKQGPL